MLAAGLAAPAAADPVLAKPALAKPGTTGADLLFAADDFRLLMAQVTDSEGRASTKSASTLIHDFDDAQTVRVAEAKSLQATTHLSVVRDTALSPNGEWVAIQMDLGGRPALFVLDATDRDGKTVRPIATEGFGIFLGWHPDGHRLLYKVFDIGVEDPGLWLVDVRDGSHRVLPIDERATPFGLVSATFSADGSRLAYSFGEGMGSGSEIRLLHLGTERDRLLYREPNGVAAELTFSNADDRLAFAMLFDSPVPFAEAGLYVIDDLRPHKAGAQARMLGLMDGGHGERPFWSDDDRELVFVARDNLDDREADQKAAALVSSIRAIDVDSGVERTLLAADGARQIDLAQTADGALLFVSNRASTELEVWRLDPREKSGPTQLTFDGIAKRHPVAVSTGR